MSNKARVIITGGGSGGHLLPMISVADGLKDQYEVVILSSTSKIDNKILSEHHFHQIKIISGKIHRYHSLWSYKENLFNLFKFIIGVVQSFIVLLFVRPRLIFSKGGYPALPVVIAGHFLRIPIILHESDLVIGLSNKIAVRYADKVCVSFSPENYDIPLDKIIFSGHILRPEIVNFDPTELTRIKNELELKELPTLLVTGGSQGALFLNKTVAKSLTKLLELVNIIHLCGQNDYQWLSQLPPTPESLGKYILKDYSQDIIQYMRLSNIILSRAGSNTLAEIAALKKTAIIVPYQYSAAGHQNKNADYFKKIGGAIVVDQDDLTVDKLYETVKELTENEDFSKQISHNAYNQNQFNGVRVIVDLIKKMIG